MKSNLKKVLCYGRENIYKPILRDKDKLLKFTENENNFRGVSLVANNRGGKR